MKIRYMGVAAYQERPVTSVDGLWQPNQAGYAEGERLNRLLATGQFIDDEVDAGEGVVTFTKTLTGELKYSTPAGLGEFRVLALGTSITNKWGDGFFATSGDYSNVKVSGDSYLFWLFVALGWPVEKVINAGVSSNTTTQMLARYDTDVAAKYALFDVFIFEPGPNDYTSGLTYSDTVGNISAIVSKAVGAGKPVLLLLPTPTEYITTTEHRAMYQDVRNWIINTYRGSNTVAIVDSSRIMADAQTGDPLSGMYVPTSFEATRVHPSISGSQGIGRSCAVAKAPGLPAANPTSYITAARDHREYLPNPRLYGANASGTDNFQVSGTNVTAASGGPSACALGIAQGTFTSVTLTPLAANGNNLVNGGGVQIVAAGAGADFDRLRLRIGSTDATFGAAQASRWDLTRANTTAYAYGDHARLATPTDGILTCVVAGTSSGTAPVPTTYGELIVDGTVTWMWQKLPSPGDVFVAEVDYEIVSVTGGVLLQLESTLMRASVSDGERFGFAAAPYVDRSGTKGMGVPGLWMPRVGKLRSLPLTLTNPGVNLRHVFDDVYISFPAGGGATINVYAASVRRISS